MEAVRLVQTAAKLIRNDTKCVEVDNSHYPPTDLMSTEKAFEYLLTQLTTFLENLFTGKCLDQKIASIGQAMMAATRPRILLTPLQFGLSVQMHHLYASRFLVDTLHSHGFNCLEFREECSGV